MEPALWKWNATALAAAVRAGEISALEIVDSHLTRIARHNPRLRAISQLLEPSARAQAAAIDARRARGEPLGPLAGVPFTVKENIAIEGVPTTHGVKHFQHFVATRDAPPVARLRAADAVVIAHSNMVELALGGVHTDSELFGATVNPWNAARAAGGTSGGDGVAVATGMAALGLGNDSGGSVRIPAAFSGVAGLKPSAGRFAADHRLGPEDPTLGSQWIPVDGPIARSVGDLRAACAVLAGADARDPRALPVPLAGSSVPLTAAVFYDAGVHPTVRRAIDTAAAALADAGYRIEPLDALPLFDEALRAYSELLMTEFSVVWPRVKLLLREHTRRYLEMSMAKVAPLDLAGYLRVTAQRLTIQRAWAELFQRYAVVLGPVFTLPGIEPGIELRDVAGHTLVTEAMRLCSVTSFVGVPAVSVSAGVFDGLPQGVQLIAGMFREDLCFDAAQAIEDRVGQLAPIDPV